MSLPTSTRTSAEFDGAELILSAWSDGLRPDPLLTVSEWADQHRVLSSRASAEPGRYRTNRTPYLREIMDCLSPSHPCRRVVFMKGAQIGATEAGNNFLGFIIHHAPGPVLAVQPTVEMATDPGIRAIVLDVDSSGGEVGGLFDLVDHIQAIRVQCGKPIWAVADEAALSAAYAIACTADRLYVTQTGEVGSIGVVAVHRDESGADAQAGLAWSFVHAGACKVDGNPHQPLSDSARATLQADVDALYGKFTTLVAERRRLSPDAVRTTEAAVYRGDQAVATGLADKVGTLRAALADLGAVLARPTISRPIAARKEVPMSESQGEVPVIAAVPQPPAQANADLEQRLRAEYSEISAIAAQATRLGVAIDPAEAMAKGIRLFSGN